MNKKIMSFWIVASLVLALIAAPLSGVNFNRAKSVEDVSMFQATKFDAHYRVPRDIDAERIMEEEGVLLAAATQGQISTAVQAFKNEFNKRNPDTPNPAKLRELLKGERGAGKGQKPESPIKSLVVPVEFPNETTFEWCGSMTTQVGPLHNTTPPPGPRDNNTIWYDDTTPALYNELYFGQGPNAGVIVHHPNLGAVDLRGNTMANYYLEQSEGKFVPAGMIYPKWLQALYAEGWYGQDSCNGASHNTKARDLVVEVIEGVMADSPDFAWQSFDGNGDGIVDNFTVIHAGMGQESGGGAQGDFAIWSHASLINWPGGYQVCTAGSAGCPDRDIFVREYSMDPEHIDIGVIAEEFGHAAFGLPDLYQTDYQGSVANWAIMEAGSWMGVLGGMQPAPFPLWFRMLCGWANPVELDYDGPATQVKVGQHSIRPNGTQQGIKVNLPDKEIVAENPLNSGQAWWSTKGDQMNNTFEQAFDLTGTTAPVFSFNSYWDIENQWDGGYVEISTDGGATWTALPDVGGWLVQDELNGNNPELNWVLTGFGEDVLSFDLSAYAGQPVILRLRYATDLAVSEPGWWADDFSLDDGATNLFFDDVEAGTDGWITSTWKIVPYTETYPQYYLVEWRNNSGFDRGLAYAYHTVYSDEDEWEVDRAPYTVPGMLVYFRDTSYLFDYTLGDSWYDPPSWGPKHGLLVVDSHFNPYTWDGAKYATGAGVRLSDRLQPGNATFTLQNTTPFTLRRTNAAVGDTLETKTFGPQPGISQFHDSLGYYPGFYWIGDGFLYWRNIAASAVVPAQADYTTRITDLNFNPFYPLYGADAGGSILGSGNPGDDGVQFGLHLAVAGKAPNGSWGMIKVWNAPSVVNLEKLVNLKEAKTGKTLIYTLRMTNTSPVAQYVTLTDPLPEGVKFKGPMKLYDKRTNTVTWSGWVGPNASMVITINVKVNKGLPKGTEITNTAYLQDSAVGGTASATTTVK